LAGLSAHPQDFALLNGKCFHPRVVVRGTGTMDGIKDLPPRAI